MHLYKLNHLARPFDQSFESTVPPCPTRHSLWTNLPYFIQSTYYQLIYNTGTQTLETELRSFGRAANTEPSLHPPDHIYHIMGLLWYPQSIMDKNVIYNFVCVYTQLSLHIYAQACRGQRLTLGIVPQELSILLAWNSPIRLGWLASKPEIPLSLPYSFRIMSAHHCA